MSRNSKDLLLLAVAIVLLAIGVFFWFGRSGKAPDFKLRLTAGDGSGCGRYSLTTSPCRDFAGLVGYR